MDFVKRFRSGKPNSTLLEPHGSGFLRITYAEDGDLEEVSWGRDRQATSNGLHLYFDWANEMVTCKTPNGLSGMQWSDGHVCVGTVYDDDDGPSDPGREIGLEDWVNECIEAMAT